MRFLPILALALLLVSCGKSDSSAGVPRVRMEVLPLNGSNVRGLYMAKFFTLNTQVNGIIPGSATIQRKNDEFMAYVRLFGGGNNVWHQQHIYEGSRCPHLGDDKNGDGFIDAEEGARVWGKILIPLDDNLNSQAAGEKIYPIGDATGGYFYEKVGSFKKLFADLRSEDTNHDSRYRKLLPTQPIRIKGAVVVVYGVHESMDLPSSIAPMGQNTIHQSLPITCSVFKEITQIPSDDDSEVPLPEDETSDDSQDDEVSEDRDDDWYDRLSNWWRRRWRRDRGGGGDGGN